MKFRSPLTIWHAERKKHRAAVASLDEASTTTRSINRILAGIEGIAFQINLLALNAGGVAALLEYAISKFQSGDEAADASTQMGGTQSPRPPARAPLPLRLPARSFNMRSFQVRA